MATAELRTSLEKFAAFARSLHGDEKSEAQTFLDHFFRAIGHGGVIEAGATFEFRIAKKPGSAQLELIRGEGARAKGGKKFADLLWPERVLIEMKSRGAKLERHYDQAFDYGTHIVPHRPPCVILCNFDEFWIYDWEKRNACAQEMGSAGFQPAASNFQSDVPAGFQPVEIPRAGSAQPFRQDAGKSGLEARAPHPNREAGASRYRLTFQRGDSVDSPWETHELPVINPALSIGTDVTGARVLAANETAKKCYTGHNPVNAGFFLTPGEAAEMIRADARNREVIFPCMIGRDLVEDYGPTRWIIDFARRDPFAARSYALPWARVQERVMPVVLAKAEAEKKAQGKSVARYTRIAGRWWQFYDYRPGTIAAIHSVPRWIALSRTSKRPIFEFISQQIHADSKLMVFAFADDSSFGILSSELHWQWTLARGGTLESRPCYPSDTVFDTFPWPQKPKRAEIAEVAAAVALRTLRREVMAAHGWSLRDLYRNHAYGCC